MERIAKFLKVSEDNFISSLDGFSKEEAKKIYEDVKLPLRATKYSAGYDFYSPFDFTLNPGETIKIPTGIRAKMREDYALFLLPRSGLGFKYRLQLNNTIGLIDADYFYSDNEGHIFAKITNDSNEGKVISVKKGEAFIQGVFLSYGITEDDEVNSIRNGGFGSTSK
ncbi:MAG: deoxyuridine 5'-triphosphate nucleotidohydrolase [Bacilli bacterium]|nr:deoxyuridine 5'-triphosphate nucleotidohydrolase [Bacilli bacterium]MDY5745799.1 deoxyuridine 5'-triphosphate nucleotidohydrolase [Bacilli bacterium]MDY6048211.1 deoxyuridine 5'-triphosphate nucleotidohydrolase [Bacilli bacterium]